MRSGLVGGALLVGLVLVGCSRSDNESSSGTTASAPIEVILKGQPVQDSFCVDSTCWPLVNAETIDRSVASATGIVAVSGTIDENGLVVTRTDAPWDDSRTIDSNPTEDELGQWLRSQQPRIESWSTEGAGDDRARVFLDFADTDRLAELEAAFGDRIDVDAPVVILNGGMDEYLALHDRIGTRPDPELRLECNGVIVAFDNAAIGSPESPGDGCVLGAYSYNSARVALAENPGPDDVELRLLVQERACASGRTPTAEETRVFVQESDRTIAVGVILTLPDGMIQDCQGNPTIEVMVQLEASVGGRSIRPYEGGAEFGTGQEAIDRQ